MYNHNPGMPNQAPNNQNFHPRMQGYPNTAVPNTNMPFNTMPPPPQNYIFPPNVVPQPPRQEEIQKPIINFDGRFVGSFEEIKNDTITGNFANIYPLNNWSKLAVRTYDETGKIKTLYFTLDHQEYPMTMEDMSKRLESIESAIMTLATQKQATTKKSAANE